MSAAIGEIQCHCYLQAVDLRMENRIIEIHGPSYKGKSKEQYRDEMACRIVFDILREMMSDRCREALVNELVAVAKEIGG